MKTRLVVTAMIVCVGAPTLAAPGSAAQTATKQRVAIVERVNGQGGGTFQLIPLSSGPLKADSGKVSMAAIGSARSRGRVSGSNGPPAPTSSGGS